jgi:hypothetical protein
MPNDNNTLPDITPARAYTPPNLPTLGEARTAPSMLAQLPLRWRKNAAAITCAGLMGALMFTACDDGAPVGEPGSEIQGSTLRCHTQAAYTEFELDIRIHHGGAGGAAYVVHLTEQEAFGIICAQLSAAGLNFNTVAPEYTVEHWGIEGGIGIELFDGEKNVAVVQLDWNQSHPRFSHTRDSLANEIAREFAKLSGDITFGVFYTSGEFLGSAYDGLRAGPMQELPPPSAEEATAHGDALRENLAAQVQSFIDLLTRRGILPQG